MPRNSEVSTLFALGCINRAISDAELIQARIYRQQQESIQRMRKCREKLQALMEGNGDSPEKRSPRRRNG